MTLAFNPGAPDTSPRALLFVDDSEPEREIMGRTLAAAFPNAEIVAASHPHHARTLCETRTFDCVLLDYNMPDMDGLALARDLRVENAYLPTILMTSVGDEMLAAEALRSGLSDYIPKSRITADSIRRSVGRSIHLCAQARLIDEQRGELENFAHALAHDFKQPIRQITTFAELISEAVREGAIDDEMQQHLRFLDEAARRLAKLVDVMSQYTLLNQPPKLGDVDLNAVLSSIKAALSPMLGERGAALTLPTQAPIVYGNETLMGQVLQNLIINGLLYNRDPNPRVDVIARRQAEHWIIEVHDNGLGIAAEHLAEVFKPLVRLHNAAEYPGTGPGLTLARKAVLTQNGAIWCESEPGVGSVFHVQLAMAESELATQPPRGSA